MNLTEEQTYQLIWDEIKFHNNKLRYQFKTLFKWWCIGCGKEIYVKYDVISLNNIFCDNPECKQLLNSNNVVQIQYLRKLKETQLQTVEKLSALNFNT